MYRSLPAKKVPIDTLGLLITLLAAACGDSKSGGNSNEIPQCEANAYLAFDSANHQSQDIRVATYTQMLSLMNAGNTVATAPQNFADAKALFLDATTSANFREKVQGRTDDHLATQPLQGERLDSTIIAWLDRGAAASSDLEAKIAKQWVDKTFTEFFFLSVYHEMLIGERAHWDEAFGYFGSKSDNNEANLEGLALTLSKRDANNGTNLRAEVFNSIIDGSCELETALRAQGLDTIDVSMVSALNSLIESIDRKLQQALAYSVGHEAFGMQAVIDSGTPDDDTMWIKLSELEPFFVPIERLMLDEGGTSATRATDIRALINMANFDQLTDTSWITTWSQEDSNGLTAPERIIQWLENEYGINIQS